MVHCLNTGEVYQPLAAFRSTFYTGTVHIHWQFIFEIIWFLLISDELIIIICLTLSWLWCWCRFMSASPGFHFWLLSGSRAHRDTCVPPITELWKFLGFKHCSLHSLSLSYLLLLSPSWTFSRESSTPLPITQTWTLCTHPHQHNHAHTNFCVQYI